MSGSKIILHLLAFGALSLAAFSAQALEWHDPFADEESGYYQDGPVYDGGPDCRNGPYADAPYADGPYADGPYYPDETYMYPGLDITGEIDTVGLYGGVGIQGGLVCEWRT